VHIISITVKSKDVNFQQFHVWFRSNVIGMTAGYCNFWCFGGLFDKTPLVFGLKPPKTAFL
jgi:hypothetical protein